MDDATGSVLEALSRYFPVRDRPRDPRVDAAARAARVRRPRRADALPVFVSALEQSLPMYIVDPASPGRVHRRRPAPLARPTAGGEASDLVTTTVRVRSAREVLHASDTARQTARRIGFSALDQTKIATAVSELARNILLYVGDGEVRVSVLTAPRRGIEIVASDSGKGIADVSVVMDADYRSRTGMGKGLKGTKRLMDHLEIATRPGVGTTVTARKFLP